MSDKLIFQTIFFTKSKFGVVINPLKAASTPHLNLVGLGIRIKAKTLNV